MENEAHQWTNARSWRVSSEPVVDIGATIGDPDYEFERIVSAVLVTGNRLAVADGGVLVVRLYDTLGTFHGAAGGEGEGPGEFRAITFMGKYRSDSLVVFDSRLHRIVILGADLTFARSLLVGSPEGTLVWPIGSFADGMLLVYGYEPGAGPDIRSGRYRLGGVLFRYEPEAGEADRLAEAPGTEIFVYRVNDFPNSMKLPFGKTSVAGVYSDGYYIASSDTYELRFYDGSNHLKRIVRRHGTQRPVTASDASAVRTRLLETPEAAPDNPHVAALRRAAAHMPIPDSMPAFGRHTMSTLPIILVDGSDNLWVLEYHFPTEAPERWAVFDPTGVFLGSVELPVAFSPLDIGNDLVVGVWRDADNVQHLRVYELVKPS